MPTRSTLGAAELIFVLLDTDRPEAGIIGALGDLVAAGTGRVLDVVIVRAARGGDVSWSEWEAVAADLAGVRRCASGLIGAEDIRHFGASVPIGGTGMLILIESSWMLRLTRDLADAGGTVVSCSRIPAAVANAVRDLGADA